VPGPEALVRTLFASSAQVERGPKDLVEARKRARALGFAATPADWRPRPLPDAENAALEYRLLTRMLEKRPLTQAEEAALGKARRTEPLTPADLQSLRHVLRDRSDLVEVVRAAAAKEGCDFRRDWRLGARLELDGYPAMRTACRLLVAQTVVLEKEAGRPAAARYLAQGFQIARHAGADPCIIGRLVAQACFAITASAMEHVLQSAGLSGDLKEAEALQQAVEGVPTLPPLRFTLQGDMMMMSADMLWLRDSEIAGLYGLMGADTKNPHDRFPPEQRQVWLNLLAAAEADYLLWLLSLTDVLEKPPTVRWAALRKFDAAAVPNTTNPIYLFRATYAPSGYTLAMGDAATLSRKRVLTAAAALLVHRAKHSSFPARLAEALRMPAPDPFTGESLQYRREANGFVIHNAGTTGNFSGAAPPDRARGEVLFRFAEVEAKG
jgi:hypothetical protein